MSAIRELPARPSLDSLRKQAKKLARDAAAGNGEAIARVHAQLPRRELPLSNRDAQLVIAREYGFAGWPDLTAEVQKRLGRALEWAASQAKAAIHDEDHERVRALLAEYPALVSWRSERGETLLDATTSYALDCSDAERERIYNRPVAAEILIDAGATVDRSTWEHVIATGAEGMLHLLARKNALPRTLPVLAALGDDERGSRVARRTARARRRRSTPPPASATPDERRVIGRALMNACRFRHVGIASRLVDRSVTLDPDLGRRIDRWQGRQAFVEFLIQHPASLWSGGSGDMTAVALVRGSSADERARRQRSACVPPLAAGRTVGAPTIIHEPSDCGDRAGQLGKQGTVHRGAAGARSRTTPDRASTAASALVFALEYGNEHLLPMLTRIWPLPDDLPHAAGTGNLVAVARWFDASGMAVLGSLAQHYPGSDPHFKGADLGWGPSPRSRSWTSRLRGRSLIDTSRWRRFSWNVAPISTPTGAHTSRRASSMKRQSRGTRRP